MKYVVEIEDATVDGEDIEFIEVENALDMGLDDYGMVLTKVQTLDDYLLAIARSKEDDCP